MTKAIKVEIKKLVTMAELGLGAERPLNKEKRYWIKKLSKQKNQKPILVSQIKDSNYYILCDGWHRLQAVLKQKKRIIRGIPIPIKAGIQLARANKILRDVDKDFNYKLLFIISLLIFPNLILFLLPYPVYDGMRLFIWTLPYFCIIPGLSVYFLIKNLKSLFTKLTFFLVTITTIYFIYDFLRITPYQYTYLNSLNGKKENRYKKFENDYWGASIMELIKNSKFDNNSTILMASCGINTGSAKIYFKNKGNTNLRFVNPKIADYIIMTNRTTFKASNLKNVNNITNCFDKYSGKDVVIVERNNQILSVIRKIE